MTGAEAEDNATADERLAQAVRRRWLNILMIAWSALLAAAAAYGGVQYWREASTKTTLGRAGDFPPGSVTAFELRTSFEDPAPVRPEARVISPVPIYLVHDSELGFMALLSRDPHSGCRVDWSESATRFEDPCAGSLYSLRGEHLAGPARRGLDRFQVIRASRDRVQVSVKLFQIGPLTQ